jgi:hypothetical protein
MRELVRRIRKRPAFSFAAVGFGGVVGGAADFLRG